jgi:large subunit ribosomal protein L22
MVEEKQNKQETKQEAKVVVTPEVVTNTEPKTEKKQTKVEVKKKALNTASVNGNDLHISTKHGMSICDMIRGKDIDTALTMLREVTVFKRAVEMNNRQVGHRHGKGIMAGRYPITAAKEFIRLVKQLKANALHNELEIEKYVMFCLVNKAGGTWKSGGRKAKRTHVSLKLILNTKIAKQKETKKGVKK